MSTHLHWEVQKGHLYLRGELTYETLQPLWLQHKKVMQYVDHINLAKLTRVDTGGLALLIHLQAMAIRHGKSLYFSGITKKLHTLITLYHLQNIIKGTP
ncbi:Intermembrane phospholipid transport system binding protein MlaB [Candidatus Erwinia haradaeae]|uniref:Intermembrane phospholipid transport system binding protein MlaB n=1 Tax=Candidatus Erwinia haradaeae TaxID=1922217 RepID=A0A451DCK8_9GAMM|nr:lipid asymmetry maintenance protein MlaB [Candidatus Erwinia haradaeae]VFP84120.1 Intermembrane phospholipid transport system binding protein MlaB [Candidatus Erwinia haradaeae]